MYMRYVNMCVHLTLYLFSYTAVQRGRIKYIHMSYPSTLYTDCGRQMLNDNVRQSRTYAKQLLDWFSVLYTISIIVLFHFLALFIAHFHYWSLSIFLYSLHLFYLIVFCVDIHTQCNFRVPKGRENTTGHV